MQHVDPDQLALLALGEAVPAGEAELTAHLIGCLECQREFRSLRATVELARETVGHRDEPIAPPAGVWSGIVAELGLGGSAPPQPRSGPDPGPRGTYGLDGGDGGVPRNGVGGWRPPASEGGRHRWFGDVPGDFGSSGDQAGGPADGHGPTGAESVGEGGRRPGGQPGSFPAGQGAGGSGGWRGSTPDIGWARGAAEPGAERWDEHTSPHHGAERPGWAAGAGDAGSARGGETSPGGAGNLDQSAGGTAGRRAARRWQRVVALTAAAAVGVLGTVAVTRPWRDQPAVVQAGSVVMLAPVAGGPAGVRGEVTVLQTATGSELRVSASGLPAPSGFYQVWVFDGKARMLAVGVLGPGQSATFPLPATLDLHTFHIVDISAEPYDGDQTHSTESVLRGSLDG